MCQCVCVLVHTWECENCVSVSLCVSSLLREGQLCPRSKCWGLSSGEPLPQFPLGVCGAGGSLALTD